ncbi:MAG TPA: DUF1801 domain-containing protein [Patescibacteria group bacterium]|nr:DUF1801 domain-containing protein [Patescibacteria group bacterium]
MKRSKDVEEYIANAPEEVQGKLRELRQIIKSSAPKAEEKISYGMPYYGYKGRLVYFAYFKNHIGVYITPPIVADFKDELKDYETHMATIRFPHDKKLPIVLIKKLIKARVKLNDEKSKKSI